jgi:thiamine biosynthesis lipoprotein
MNYSYYKHKKGHWIHCLSVLLCLLSFIIFSLTGCGAWNFKQTKPAKDQEPCITKSSFLLNTVVSVQIYDKKEEALLDGCFSLIQKYSTICSRTDKNSELYALNHGTLPHNGLTYKVSKDLSDIMKYGLYYSKLSGGVFDISIAPVSSLWNFTAEKPSLPSDKAITKALAYVNYKNITQNEDKITFSKKGVAIDLGGIAKGYIADRLKNYLMEHGVKSAVINLGGNVLCIGRKPDGSPFHIGIQKPYADRNKTIAVMEISNQSVVSSGIYERFFTIGGKSYHHILNPKTGYPYNNNIVSVTIISPLSVDGDGLSTTCFALGLKKGLALIESMPNTYAVFITKDDVLHYSKGFQKAIPIVK